MVMMEIEGGKKGKREGRRGQVASRLKRMHLLIESFQPFPSHLQNDSVSQCLFKKKKKKISSINQNWGEGKNQSDDYRAAKMYRKQNVLVGRGSSYQIIFKERKRVGRPPPNKGAGPGWRWGYAIHLC